jgi:hypothetical protein
MRSGLHDGGDTIREDQEQGSALRCCGRSGGESVGVVRAGDDVDGTDARSVITREPRGDVVTIRPGVPDHSIGSERLGDRRGCVDDGFHLERTRDVGDLSCSGGESGDGERRGERERTDDSDG